MPNAVWDFYVAGEADRPVREVSELFENVLLDEDVVRVMKVNGSMMAIRGASETAINIIDARLNGTAEKLPPAEERYWMPQ